MSATSGPTSEIPLAFLDPDGSSWRMSQGTLALVPPKSLQILPPFGFTVDGKLFALRAPERLTKENDSSSLDETLMPTPTSRDRQSRGVNAQGGPQLAEALMPTPTARDWKDTGPNTNYEKLAAKSRLAGTVHLLPTPVAGFLEEDPAVWLERREKYPDNGRTLAVEMAMLPTPETPTEGEMKLLPTPRAQNGEARNMKIWKRPLDQPQNLENALARLDGDDTSQLSDDGNES